MKIFIQVFALILLSTFWFFLAAVDHSMIPSFLHSLHPIGFYLLGLLTLGLGLVRMLMHLYRQS